jgi:hypothetical protein
MSAIIEKINSENRSNADRAQFMPGARTETMRIVKCWHLLQTIADSGEVIPAYRDYMEAQLQ